MSDSRRAVGKPRDGGFFIAQEKRCGVGCKTTRHFRIKTASPDPELQRK